MSAAPVALHPPVSWAQRNDVLYVIIEVECKDIDYKFTDSSMKFTGTDVLDSKRVYDLQLNFLKTIDPERVSSKNIARCLEFTIYKKQSGPYWSSLTNDKTKLHFLKANFNKWKDESDDEEPEHDTIEAPWNKFMDDSSELKNFDDFEDDDDSDDNIPSLSQNDEDDEADEKTKADKTQKSALNEKI